MLRIIYYKGERSAVQAADAGNTAGHGLGFFDLRFQI
jgi:hypothetical protein